MRAGMAAQPFGVRKGTRFNNAVMVHISLLHNAARRLQARSAHILRRTALLVWVAACLLWGGPAEAVDCEPPGACGGWAVDDHWTQQGRGAPRERQPVQEHGHGRASLLFGPA